MSETALLASEVGKLCSNIKFFGVTDFSSLSSDYSATLFIEIMNMRTFKTPNQHSKPLEKVCFQLLRNLNVLTEKIELFSDQTRFK